MIVAFANLSFKSLQRHQQQLLLFVQPVCMVVRADLIGGWSIIREDSLWRNRSCRNKKRFFN